MPAGHMASRLGQPPGCGAASCAGPTKQAWFFARRGCFFGGDAVSGVGVSPLAVKLRPSKHSCLFGGRITGANSVSEAFEGLCDGVVGVKRRGGSAS